MEVYRVDSGGVNHYVGIELPRIVSKVVITATYFITPSADVLYFIMPFDDSSQFVFVGRVGKPDRVVEVIDHFLSQDFGDDPFKYRGAYGSALAVDEDIPGGGKPGQYGDASE